MLKFPHFMFVDVNTLFVILFITLVYGTEVQIQYKTLSPAIGKTSPKGKGADKSKGVERLKAPMDKKGPELKKGKSPAAPPTTILSYWVLGATQASCTTICSTIQMYCDGILLASLIKGQRSSLEKVGDAGIYDLTSNTCSLPSFTKTCPIIKPCQGSIFSNHDDETTHGDDEIYSAPYVLDNGSCVFSKNGNIHGLDTCDSFYQGASTAHRICPCKH